MPSGQKNDDKELKNVINAEIKSESWSVSTDEETLS